MLFIMLLPIIENKIVQWLEYYKHVSNIPGKYTLNVSGYITHTRRSVTVKMPIIMEAISKYIFDHKLCDNFLYQQKMDVYYNNDSDTNTIIRDTEFYIPDNIYMHKKMSDNVFLKINIEEPPVKENIDPYEKTITVFYTLFSDVSIECIELFIETCVKYYKNLENLKNKNKLYHHRFIESNNEKLIFSTKILSDGENIKMTESFNNIFHEHTDSIIKQIDKLSDIKYYERTGLRRKLGFLFYGIPGSGKTATVMAIANRLQRHILEIPISKIDDSLTFERIMSLEKINNCSFKNSELIILFDEIGQNFNNPENNTTKDYEGLISLLQQNPKKNEDLQTSKSFISSSKKKLAFDVILSQLDGIGNHDGLIVIGTTNSIDNLPPALYRDGRLSLVKFSFMTLKDVNLSIKHFYEIDKKVSELKKKIVGSSLIRYMETHTIDETIEFLSC